MPILLNMTGFVACWLMLAIGAFNNLVWLALLIVAGWAWLNLHYSLNRRSDLQLLFLCVLIGPLPDIFLLSQGLIQYAPTSGLDYYPPLWLPAMWANFALILNRSLRWLYAHKFGMRLMGRCAGPASYVLGEFLGCVELQPPALSSYLLIAGSWALIWYTRSLYMQRQQQAESLNATA